MPRKTTTNKKAKVEGVALETRELRKSLTLFLDHPVIDPITHLPVKLGNYKFGAYAFFDYDNEPIYVGQTSESLRTRIRRHLTNQRTDAVAMNVLDPFEVYTIKVWPLFQFEGRSAKDKEARRVLNALEYQVFHELLAQSKFHAVLNEKEPIKPSKEIELPSSYSGTIVSEKVYELRSHPDIRIARRALTMSKLAQVISERQVNAGLRKTLLTQAQRLASLAERRYEETAPKVSPKSNETP